MYVTTTRTGTGEAVIVGAGLGGLSAAIHLRLAGIEVRILEMNESTGGRANQIRLEGFTFDTGPSLLNYPWVFEELFRAAGRRLSDYVSLISVDPSVSFQWPDGTRFSLSADLQNLIAECERLEPGSGPGLMRFLADAERKYELSFSRLIPGNGKGFVRWLAGLSPAELLRTSLWRSLDSELARFFRSPYIKEALGSYGMYLGGSPYRLPGLFSILPYGELGHGLWLPKGGVYSVVRAIERLARELGVSIETGARVRRILIERKRVAGVRMEDGSVVRTRIVVSNVDVPTTNSSLIDPAELSRRSRRRMAGLRMTPAVVTFYWGIRGTLSGIGHHTIFLPSDYRKSFEQLEKGEIPSGLPFYLSIPSATDPDLAPPGDTAMFALVPVPPISRMPADTDWARMAGELKRRVLARVFSHCGGAGDIVFEEVYNPIRWRERFGLYDGSAFGAAHTLRQMGPLRPPNESSDIEGLYYVGASTTPGTGMPMVVLSGAETAARVVAGRGDRSRPTERTGDPRFNARAAE